MKKLRFLTLCAGVLMFALGLVLAVFLPDSYSSTAIRILPFGLIGYGSGIFGAGLAGVIMKKKIEKDPETARQYEIKEKDERLIRIRERAGYVTWFVTLITGSAVVMIFMFMNNLAAMLIACGFLMIHVICYYAALYVIINRM